MGVTKRVIVFFESDVYKALRRRAAASRHSLSDLVNDAVRISLAQDTADLDVFDARAREKAITFESFVAGMRRRGKNQSLRSAG
jgi:hypothetical protein